MFPPLAAYTRWFSLNRTWPNGSYWGTGWSTGMDNQPRIPENNHLWYEHCHQTWVDTCMQAVLADRMLINIAEEIGRQKDVEEFKEEADKLTKWINDNLWDKKTKFYHDLKRDSSKITDVKTIGAYWALISQVVTSDKLDDFISHLTNDAEFKRKHCVPSISADTKGYDSNGGYWRGAVWAPTNYMLLRGLSKFNKFELSHEIAKNHLENVVNSFVKTGTLWENYSPDYLGEGRSTKDFVGWTGIPPVSVLFEHVFGIMPYLNKNKIIWDVRLTEKHGILKYPYKEDGEISFICEERNNEKEEPKVYISGKEKYNLNIVIYWDNRTKSKKLII